MGFKRQESKKRVSRFVTKGKGKRWKKGQSSSSNPKMNRHRQQVRRKVFGGVPGQGQLTEAAIKQHNAQQGDNSKFDLEDDAESESQSRGAKTCETFATSWTECSNPSFDRLLKNWQSSSAHQKEMLAVLAAVTEVIKARGGKETETEYFAALVTTLASLDREESVSAIVSLLHMVIKRLPPSVLELRFSDTAKLFIGLLGKYAESKHGALLRGLIDCLCILLRAQKAATWSLSSTMQVYNVVLNFTIHVKPRVRKAAQHAVCSILKGSAIMTNAEAPPHHPAAAETAKFCMQRLEECGGSGAATTSLHTLGLLREILACFPHQSLKTTAETILRVMTLSDVLVKSCSLQALHGLFSSKPRAENLPADLNGRITSALYDYQPSHNDGQLLPAWLSVMKAAIINLHRLDEKLCLSHLSRFFAISAQCWLSDKQEVLLAVTDTLQDVLIHCVQPSAPHFKLVSHETVTPAHSVISTLEGSLKYQYHAAWGYVLTVISTAFNVLGKHCPSLMTKCLQSMADLHNSHHFLYKFELEKAMGMAIRVMGPDLVLQAVPLLIDGKSENPDLSRSWLLPIIRDYTRETKLEFFIRYFLPLATLLRTKGLEMKKENRNVEAKTYDLLQNQIWSLLPGFCTCPTDLEQSFKGIAKILGTALSEGPDLRLTVLSSLRLLITKNVGNESSTREMARFAKNYLPILFNLYGTEPKDASDESIRLAVYDTAKVYLGIADEQLVSSLFDKAMEKLRDQSIVPFNRNAVVDLSRAMLPYVKQDQLHNLYTYCKPFLQNEDRTAQKKAYRVMEELCGTSSDACSTFVQENLSELREVFVSALSSSVPSSKAPRLRCLCHIVRRLKEPNFDFVRAVIPEAVLCTKEQGEKARTAAYNLVVELGHKFQHWKPEAKEDALQQYIQLLLAGLAGSPHMVSASILAIGRAVLEFKACLCGKMIHLLIENMCLLLESRNRDIIRSILSFMKVILSVLEPTDLVQHVEGLVKRLASIPQESRRHFHSESKQLFTKLVRMYGHNMISKLLPENYRKLLNNIRKSESRRLRNKLQKDNRKESDTSSERRPMQSIEDLLEDSEDEMLLGEVKSENTKPKKGKKTQNVNRVTWIEEGRDDIVNLLDPKVSQKVIAQDPHIRRNNVTHHFKTAADGRLIITDNEEETQGMKKKTSDVSNEDILQVFANSSQGKKRKLDDGGSIGQVSDSKGSGSQVPILRGNQKLAQQDTGAVFRAKKAKGDVKKTGLPDPYAYFPLNRQALNKRNRARLGGQFKSIISSAMKGAQKGRRTKARNKSRRKR